MWYVGPVSGGWLAGYQARSRTESADAARMDAVPGESDPLVTALRKAAEETGAAALLA